MWPARRPRPLSGARSGPVHGEARASASPVPRRSDSPRVDGHLCCRERGRAGSREDVCLQSCFISPEEGTAGSRGHCMLGHSKTSGVERVRRLVPRGGTTHPADNF